MKPNSVLLVGIKGHVVCIRKSDGVELWRKSLKGSGLVNICRDGEGVFAASSGYIYSLNWINGDIYWVNNLPKLGFGTCVMGTPGQSAVATLSVVTQQQAAMAATATAVAAGGAVAGASG